MPEQRHDTNFLRVLAILFVVNSHMDNYYPKEISFFATGGMIGNTLFFLLSSMGLLLSMKKTPRTFGSWYARRILRIYPSVWITVILISFPVGIYNGLITLDNLLDAMGKFFYPPFWFLQALLLFYCVIYFIIKSFSYKRLVYITIPFVIGYCFYYIFLIDRTTWSIETLPFKLIFYFLVMLWGLYLISRNEIIQFSGIRDFLFLILSIACIYGHKYLMHRGLFMSFQFVQHLASFPMLYYFIKVARSSFVRDQLMNNGILGRLLTFISTITLEIFIVDNSIVPLHINFGYFPFNAITVLLLTFGFALLVFYCVKPIRKALEISGTPI